MYNFLDTAVISRIKDEKLRYLFYSNELKIKFIKMLILDKRINYNVKFLIKNKYLNLYGLKTNSIRNYCILSGKSRFIFTFFNLNRSSLKFYLSFGYFSGFRRW